MIIGDRLRDLREQRQLSQSDIEKRTGLLCGYISRVENGHTVRAMETLAKLARTMDVPYLSCSTTAKKRLKCRTSRSAERRTTWHGGTPAKTQVRSDNFEDFWARRTKTISGFFCTWRRRWRDRAAGRPRRTIPSPRIAGN